MTEDEAKTKWCPHVRSYDGNIDQPVTMNRDYDGEIFPQNNCIASDCAMWVLETKIKDVPDKDWYGHGHCGLINK